MSSLIDWMLNVTPFTAFGITDWPHKIIQVFLTSFVLTHTFFGKLPRRSSSKYYSKSYSLRSSKSKGRGWWSLETSTSNQAFTSRRWTRIIYPCPEMIICDAERSSKSMVASSQFHITHL